MSSGNDAHIHLNRLVTTDSVELAIGQHPQQTGLYFQRHIADLIQKQGTAIGLLEAAVAHAVGTGKGSLFVAEELGFDQLFWNGGHV